MSHSFLRDSFLNPSWASFPANYFIGGRGSQHKGNKQHQMACEKPAGFGHLPEGSEAGPSDTALKTERCACHPNQRCF